MTVTFGYAIGQGNVGTLYRHKGQVFGFYYAFAAIGMENRRRQPQPLRYPSHPMRARGPVREGSAVAYSRRPRES